MIDMSYINMSQYITTSSSSLEYKTKYDIKLYLKDVFG